ncbi:hypothetical protein AVDCRST_MAG84-6364 [uncultured Microcoleus sp.]|uniref:Uncharacterized protein n=1 Tax=uncultured Microcoleus sp. TaxID=259945 RepID=A0A6J4P465_9CYAN|nr:hypothetical protein AVDCRST_MAG84-6364 [uncultured Microcoleus sp.]
MFDRGRVSFGIAYDRTYGEENPPLPQIEVRKHCLLPFFLPSTFCLLPSYCLLPFFLLLSSFFSFPYSFSPLPSSCDICFQP